MRKPLVVTAITLIAGLSAAALLRAEIIPGASGPACEEVLAGKADVTPRLPTAPGPYSFTVPLNPRRSDVIGVIQIIDDNGFGWLRYPLPGGGEAFHANFSNSHYTHTIRLGLMAPAEAERADAIRRAARAFDARTWLRERGWIAPNLTLCQTIHLP